MGCKLSIGIKGDNTYDNADYNLRKVVPISHEQSTSPMKSESKEVSVNTNVVHTEAKETNTSPVHKNPKRIEEETISPDSPDGNGTESINKHSKNRLTNKARLIRAIVRKPGPPDTTWDG